MGIFDWCTHDQEKKEESRRMNKIEKKESVTSQKWAFLTGVHMIRKKKEESRRMNKIEKNK